VVRLKIIFALMLTLSLATHLRAQAQDDFLEPIPQEEEEDDGSITNEDIDPVEEPTEQAKPSQKADVSPMLERDAPRGSGKSEKIFDWSKHQNERLVPHPFAEKGLMRITKQNEYIYKVNETPQNRAAGFRLGSFNPVNLENPDKHGEEGATFEQNYNQTDSPALMFDYEWHLWKTGIGKMGLKAGSGAYVAQGNGHFKNEYNAGLPPREVLTFWAMPNSLGVVYRMHRWDKQLLVPYAEGGGVVMAFGEVRDDGKAPKWGGALAAYYAFGCGLNLTYFDAMSRIQLDREYGINRVYLVAEFRGMIAITQRYDFTSDMIDAGLLMEF
jgi:hypothetical protein